METWRERFERLKLLHVAAKMDFRPVVPHDLILKLLANMVLFENQLEILLVPLIFVHLGVDLHEAVTDLCEEHAG